MEPRALANLNGNLVPATTTENETPAKPVPAGISPTKEFLTFDTPASRRDSFAIDPAHTHVAVDDTLPTAPATPTTITTSAAAEAAAESDNNDEVLKDNESTFGSPTTPYYLSKGAKLVQQTCPPKQMAAPMGSLFPVSGNIEDQPDETVRRRLVEARRKSLQWGSRVRSPLGRVVSYGK